MKPTLDNHIDQLFKASLEEYKVKPSAGSWRKINAQLGGKHRGENRTAWLAAASIILVVGLGFIFFGNKQEVIKLTGNNKAAFLQDTLPVTHQVVVEPITKEPSLAEVKIANEKHFLAILKKSNISSVKREKIKQEVAITESKITNSYAVVTTHQEIGEEVFEKPDDLKLTLNTATEEPMFTAVHQVKNSSNFKETVHPEERSVIKSVGNIVNFVIAKVDNRKRKLLHVSSTEESDMEITQINLGLIKYKKN